MSSGRREASARQISQRYYHLRIDGRQLGEQIRPAGVDLRRLRGAALGRFALDERREVDLLALHSHGDQETVEKHPGRPAKRLALLVLIEARRLAHDEEFGV